MAFRFIEIPHHLESTANPPTLTYHFKAVGTQSQSYVHSFTLGATAPMVSTIYGILHRQDIRVRQIAYNHFSVQVPYGRRPNVVGEWTWDFDTTGGTVHITNSKETIAAFPGGYAPGNASSTVPDMGGAINVTRDEVKGVDVVIPALKINVHYKHPMGAVTLAWAKVIHNITGSVNSTSMLTFAPGEVLFLGGRGSDGTVVEGNVTYSFAMSANATGLSFGDIADIAKRGWEVAWIAYKDNVKTTGGDSKSKRVKEPEYVYIERVYDTADLAGILNFGG